MAIAIYFLGMINLFLPKASRKFGISRLATDSEYSRMSVIWDAVIYKFSNKKHAMSLIDRCIKVRNLLLLSKQYLERQRKMNHFWGVIAFHFVQPKKIGNI